MTTVDFGGAGLTRATPHTRTWPAEARQLSGIRAHTRAWLSNLGLDADVVSDVVMAVNEAVSNVVEHAYPSGGGTVDLIFSAEADLVGVEVVDHGRWRTPAELGIGSGFGITIMKQVLDSVAIRRGEHGTRVQLLHARGPDHVGSSSSPRCAR